METAFKYLVMAGYDGIEISAIDSMNPHLRFAHWREDAAEMKQLSAAYGLELLAIEQPRQDIIKMETTMQAATEAGIPIINCGPGGKSDDEDSFQQSIDTLGKLADMAEKYGVTLCIKAHVGQCVYNTPTTLRLMEAIASPALG
ncbi:MAG TPA: TIM barrel protein, partial [Aggregatilineales bacterium]|nr:TIM barrel protein [Aggregatilineales bacterium]